MTSCTPLSLQRASAERRMQVKEVEAAKQRAVDARKKEQHRQLAIKYVLSTSAWSLIARLDNRVAAAVSMT